MHRAIVRIDAETDPAAVTAETDLRVELWCNDHCDLLHAVGSDPDPFLDAVRETCGVRDTLRSADELVAITGDCLADHEPAVDPVLAAHDCLLVGPIVYAGGDKRICVLALDPAALSAAYDDLCERFAVTVESVRTVDTGSPRAVGDPTPGSPATEAAKLSSRQREVLRIAHRDGYFEIPRGTTTEAIADEVGIDRRTAEEHLRKAERTVIDAFADRRFP